MNRWMGVLFLVLTGCVNPTGQWLQTVQNTKAEPALRERFGEPIARTDIKKDGMYALYFEDGAKRANPLQVGCQVWWTLFDQDGVLKSYTTAGQCKR